MKTPNFMIKLCCEAHLKLVLGAVSLQSALWFEDIPRTQPLGCHNGGNDLWQETLGTNIIFFLDSVCKKFIFFPLQASVLYSAEITLSELTWS